VSGGDQESGKLQSHVPLQGIFGDSISLPTGIFHFRLAAWALAATTASEIQTSTLSLPLTDCGCRACLLAMGVESAMRRGPACRVADFRGMRAEAHPTRSSAGPTEPRALVGCELPRGLLVWLDRVLAGPATAPRPDFPGTE
jgi:hypothetical protein